MQPIAEDDKGAAPAGPRKLLVAIDDNSACERALEWALSEFYRPGDEVHLIHVIPRAQPQPQHHGAPPVDQLGGGGEISYAVLVKRAQQFIEARFLPKMRGLSPQGVVHIVKGAQDADGIGAVICDQAAELPATAVVIASQGKSRFQQFFLGSTSAYVSKSCRCPVCLVH